LKCCLEELELIADEGLGEDEELSLGADVNFDQREGGSRCGSEVPVAC